MITYDSVLEESEILRLKLLSTIDRAKRMINVCNKKKKKTHVKKPS